MPIFLLFCEAPVAVNAGLINQRPTVEMCVAPEMPVPHAEVSNLFAIAIGVVLLRADCTGLIELNHVFSLKKIRLTGMSRTGTKRTPYPPVGEIAKASAKLHRNEYLRLFAAAVLTWMSTWQRSKRLRKHPSRKAMNNPVACTCGAKIGYS